ncbi:MAG: GIY-YIG nuclease family protein [Burkholderiales bacterium]|nr:GIY-YIG nuclease family protein [Burkholderiales bacterium]
MSPVQFNTHTKSPGWVPLKKIFLSAKSDFLRKFGGQRFSEKHLIGAAMWKWLCESGQITQELRAYAEAIHYRPGKERDGLPLWRLVFKATIRNTPEIDALFSGARKGPTPRYARLAAAGLVPDKPADFVARPAAEEPTSVQPDGPNLHSAYRALNEWVLDDLGIEWVYVYTTKRELENFANAGIEPLLKVGQTRLHYSQRIGTQVASTASNSPFVCTTAYRTRDAQQLEAAIHKALKLQDRHVRDAPGIEWFQVTPEALHTLVQAMTGKTL